jgi:DNA-binding NtrC family response regulator
VDVRVVAASNRDLAQLAGTGAFREDLYFRLAVIPIAVPSLRERAEDIPLLIEHFAAMIASEAGRRPRPFALEAVGLLRHYEFPGNVRELRNLVERLVIMTQRETIGVADIVAILPAPARMTAPDATRLLRHTSR